MRVTALSVVCTTALILPAVAVPLANTFAPFAGPTLVVNGPEELLTPSLPTMPAASRNNQVQRLSKTKPNKLLRLPRADFRQADYGVNHNVTLVKVPVPVQGVEATPPPGAAPPTMLGSRSDDDWEANRLHPDYATSAASSAGDFPGAAPDPSGATSAVPVPAPAPPLSAAGGTPSSGSASPLAVGDITKADANHVPFHPNAAVLSSAFGEAVKDVGNSRYRAAYAAHDTLGAAMLPANAQSSSFAKSPAQLDKLGTASVAHGLLRRVLEPARYVERSIRRAFSLAKGLSHHTLELNTEPLLPSRPDPSLNMSDPYIAQEEMRKEHAGVVNIDSNRPAPPPPALHTDNPLNATNATAALDDGAGAAKNGTALPVEDDAKTSLDKDAKTSLDKDAKTSLDKDAKHRVDNAEKKMKQA